jgi:hypothetical protein
MQMSTVITRFVFTLVFMAIASGDMAAAQSRQAQVVDANVCEVLRDPQSFNGKTIRLKAYALTSMHATSIHDASSEKNGIILIVPKELTDEAGRFVDESFGPEVFDGEKKVSAIVTGRIEWNPGRQPVLALVLSGISDIEVVTNKDKSKKSDSIR